MIKIALNFINSLALDSLEFENEFNPKNDIYKWSNGTNASTRKSKL